MVETIGPCSHEVAYNAKLLDFGLARVFRTTLGPRDDPTDGVHPKLRQVRLWKQVQQQIPTHLEE